MTKRLVWKVLLLGILAACTAAGLVLLHQGSGKGAAVTKAYAAEATVTQDGLSYELSDDGDYYILDGFAEGATDKTSVSIPDAIGDIPVTEVEAKAFKDATTITSVTIGANMKTFGTEAFSGLTELENIYYGSKVEYDSKSYGSLTSSSEVFSGMGAETDNGVTITISKDTTSLPAYMFASSTSSDDGKLYKVVFEDNSYFSYSGNYAFGYLTDSDSISVYFTDLNAWCVTTFSNIYANPVSWGADAYLNNELLEDLVIPEDVTEVYDYAFYGCKSLRSLNIHKNVSSIGTGVFQTCASLEYIYFNAEFCTVSTEAFNSIGTDTKGVTLVIGKDVHNIGNSAFAGLNSKTGNDTITFEQVSTLNKIDDQAFHSAGFTSITLPGSVSYIGNLAFFNTGITADTLYLENPYDWYTTNSSSSTYAPDEAAAGIITNTNISGRTSYYASAREVLRGYVDETSDAADFSVSLWWYERYEWTAEISGTKADGTAVSGPYSNYDKITEPGEYAITLTNSGASDTLTFYIHIQDAVTTDPTCTEDGLEQYLVSYTVDGETYDLDPCNIILPATGHTYSSAPAYWTWEQADGTGAYMAYAWFECDEGDYTLPVTASVTYLDNGTTYYATVTSDGQEYSDIMHVHSYLYTSCEWSDDYSSCTLTYTCAGADGDMCDEHTVTYSATVTSFTTPATCTEDGQTVYKASYGGEVITSYTVTIPATGHTYGEPHWSWTMDEETGTLTASATFYCTEWDDEQTITATIEKEPTDFATIYHATVTAPDGVTTYTSSESVAHLFNVSWSWTEATDGYTAKVTLTCQICGNSFEYDATVTEKAHRDTACTTAGYTSYEAVFTLGSGDDAVTYTDTKTDVLNALGHDYTSEVTDPTCTEQGYTTYTCSRCGDTYVEDGSYTDALGHDYNYTGAEWTWYDSLAVVKVEIFCTRCDDVITSYVQTTSETTKEATCTETGVLTYTATYTYGDNEESSITDTKDVEIPANGHTYETTSEFSWTGDVTNGYTAATLTFTCSVCDDSVTEDATLFMSEDGTTCTARVVFEGTVYTDTQHVHVYAISDSESDTVWGENYESCTITFRCIGTDCDDSYTRDAVVTSETTDPTCTEDGQTLYTATYEGEVVATTATVIDKTGHTYGTPEWEWTKGEDGSYTATATFFCEYGDDAQVVNATITKDTDVEKSTYTATAYDPNHPEDDSYKYTATTNVEHILDASWEWVAVTDANGSITGYNVTLTLTCQICGTNFVRTSISGEVTVSVVYQRDAACEVTGVTRYEATYVYKADGEADLTYTDSQIDTEPALEHEYYAVGITHATCTTDGYVTYICDICGHSYEEDYETAYGHHYDYAEAVWTWNGTGIAEAVVTCTRCGEEEHSGYKESSSAITKEATCTEDGVTTYTVTWQYGETEDKSISDSITEAISATGHDYDTENAEWAWADDNTAAITFTCKTCQHEETVDADVILGDNGTTYYATAVFEGKTYESSKHVHVYAMTADWTDATDGDGKACTITFTCMGETCSYSYTAEADVTSEITTEPTCTEKGETLYTATYEGEVVSTTTEEIEATGHTYSGEPTWSWDTDEDGKYTVTATFQCDAWDDVQEIEATVTSTPSAFATNYTATVTGPDGQTYTKTRSVEHVFEIEWKWEEADDTYTATVTLTCQICGNKYTYETKEGEVVVEQKAHRDATCTTQGYTVYEAEYTHGEDDETVTYTNRYSVVIDALGHDYTASVTEATCTEQGYTTYTCSRCGDTYVDDYTEATGHTYTKDNITWEWEGTSAALLIITCDTCDSPAVMQYIEATDAVTTDPSCTEAGEKTFTVTYYYTDANGDTQSIYDTTTEDIAATGHSYEIEWKWTEDEENGGYSATATFTCSEGDDEQTETGTVTLGDYGTTYTATVTFNDETYTDQNHVHSYMLTHSEWGEDEDGNVICTVTLVCVGDFCGHYTKTDSAVVTSEITVEATCTEPGTAVYTATYNEVVVAYETLAIPATGHESYGEPVWSWTKNEDGTYSATAIFTCEKGDDVIQIAASVSSVTEGANTTHTATVTGPDGETYTDESTSHKHLYTITWTWTEDYSSATITIVCVDGDTDPITETAEVTQTAHVAPGCETDGYTTYEATYTSSGEDAVTYTDVQTIMLEPHGHSYESITYDPTCVDEGYTLHSCRICGNMYETDSKAATGEHEIDETTEEWDWVLNADGTYSVYVVYVCVAEGTSYHTVSYAAHMTSYVELEPTCVETGIMVWTASYGGHAAFIEAEIPATGLHTGTLSGISVNETAKTVSASCICSVCGNNVIDSCCIIVTDYYGKEYTFDFVNGVADYSSVAYAASIVIWCTDGTSTKVDITPVVPAEPVPVPEEPAEGGLAGWAIALIVLACVIVVAAIVLVVLLMLRRKNKAGSSGDKKQ